MAHTDLKSHTRCSVKLKQWNLSITVTFGPQFLGLNKQMAALDIGGLLHELLIWESFRWSY